MQIGLLEKIAIAPALELLPQRMDSPAARVMMIAIAIQESGLTARRQLPRGPARGYWQFEQGGAVAGVLRHRATRAHAKLVCAKLDYSADDATVHAAIEHNDILAAAFARLLLFSLPAALPITGSYAASEGPGWDQYTAAWRPGHERPEKWPGSFRQAWEWEYIDRRTVTREA